MSTAGSDLAGSLPCHVGRCHCGAVQFEFCSDVCRAVLCNCSYCTRKAALHHRVPADRFFLRRGGGKLALYQFGTLRARHFFCRACGIHTHCHPRSAPDEVNVNLHCVDALDALLPSLEIAGFDGREWAAS